MISVIVAGVTLFALGWAVVYSWMAYGDGVLDGEKGHYGRYYNIYMTPFNYFYEWGYQRGYRRGDKLTRNMKRFGRE